MAAYRNLSMFRHMDDVELSMCRLCNRACHRKALQGFFVLTSRLGNGLFWYVLVSVLPLLYGYQGWHTSLRMAVAGVLGVMVYKLLKSRLVRQRPYIRHGTIHRGTVSLRRIAPGQATSPRAGRCCCSWVGWRSRKTSVF